MDSSGKSSQNSGEAARPRSELRVGDFPFPLTGSTTEPAPLRWLRNHSSYLTVGGLHDYFVPAAVLARGIAINFLILVPWLILISIVLSFSHHWILNQKYLLLQTAAAAAVLICLIYLVGTPIIRILRYRRSLERGSIDTAEQRIFRETLLGLFLILVLFIAFIEVSPWVIEIFRSQFGFADLTWSQKLASIVGLSTVLGGSNAILTRLAGHTRTIAIVLIGIAGLMVPWSIILYVTNYLVYDPPPFDWLLGVPFWIGLVCALLTFFAFLVGIFQKSFTGKEKLEMSVLFSGVAVVVAGLWFAWDYAEDERARTEIRLGELSRPLTRIIRSKLMDDSSNAGSVLESLSSRAKVINKKFNAQPPDTDPSHGRWHREYYQLAQDLIENGEDLRKLSDIEQFEVRRAIAVRDREELLKLIESRGEKDASKKLSGLAFRRELVQGRIYQICKRELEDHFESPEKGFTSQYVGDLFRKWEPKVGIERLERELKETRLPAPMLDEFYKISKRDSEKEESAETKRSTSNRSTLKSVNLIADSTGETQNDISQDSLEEYRRKAFTRLILENQEFSVLRDSELLQATPDSIDAAPDAALVAMVKDTLIKRALRHFTTRQLMLLADMKMTIHRSFPETETPEPTVGDFDDVTTIWHALQALHADAEAGTDPEKAKLARDLLAKFYTDGDSMELAGYARRQLITRALGQESKKKAFVDIADGEDTGAAEFESEEEEYKDGHRARIALGELYKPSVPSTIPEDLINQTSKENPEIEKQEELIDLARLKLYQLKRGSYFQEDELLDIVTAHFLYPDRSEPDELAARMVTGEFGTLKGLEELDERLFLYAILSKLALVCSWAIIIALLCWLAADININSLHGYYRDRLARAFLIRLNSSTKTCEVDDDIALASLANRHTRSTAPYHLINVALNLQGSSDVDLRDRKSDFFIFSKRFVGGDRTGYCRTSTLGQIFPQANLPTAMAISAAAASPNMGRITNPFLVLLMTLLNIRLGFWIPHPGLIEETQNERQPKKLDSDKNGPPGFMFQDVFKHELIDIQERWEQAYSPVEREIQPHCYRPTVQHGLVGLAFSGGGIRSATVNLGILQVLNQCGLFNHVDYMSTVSGGGYLGSSISAQMRNRTTEFSQNDGTVDIQRQDDECVVMVSGKEQREYRFSREAQLEVRDGENIGKNHRLIRRLDSSVNAEFDGTVKVDDNPVTGARIVSISETTDTGDPREFRYTFTRFDPLIVKTGSKVKAGDPLVARRSSLSQRFIWAVAPRCFYSEMFGLLNEDGRWVNLSDGGHIENLAMIELLRRRCKFIIAGDGEADPNHTFNGLATLLRFARIDLGIEIEIQLDPLRKHSASGESEAHWAIGKITYPKLNEDSEDEVGYLIYLKSSVTGDEEELINEYRSTYPDFPHQSTADQFFNEGQFEAHRALGQHIGETLLDAAGKGGKQIHYEELQEICESLWSSRG